MTSLSGEIDPRWLPVPDAGRFFEGVRRRVNNAVGSTRLKTVISGDSQGEEFSHYIGVDTDVRCVEPGGQEPRPVFPLFPGDPSLTSWWGLVHASFFRSVQSTYLKRMTLIVLEGSRIDQQKQPLCRAEWDGYVIGDSTGHAQPHWHPYVPTSRIADQISLSIWDIDWFFDLNRDELIQRLELLDEMRRLRHFHFAMASDFPNGARHSQAFESGDRVALWTTECLKYIRRQIRFLEN